MFTALFLRAALILCAAAAFPAFGQTPVPQTVAKITSLDTSSATPQLAFQNTGTKALAAIVFRNLTPEHRGEVVITQYSPALAPGAADSVRAWPDLDGGRLATQVEIVAVIFADGTHLGSAPDPADNGTDAVDEVFEQRRGAADELRKWAKLVESLPPDDLAALGAFVKSASALPPDGQYSTAYELGVANIQRGMRARAERIAAALRQGSDAKSVRAQYLGHIPEDAATAAKLARKATQ